MPPILILLVLGLQGSSDPLGPYTAVLQNVREQFPERQIILTTTVARPDCYPHCSDTNYAQVLAPELLTKLEEQQLIVGSCKPEPRTIGCSVESGAWSDDRIMVTLGPVEPTKRGVTEVNEVLIWRKEQRGREIDSTQGHRYRLSRGDDGRWRVVSSSIVWVV